ncbi:hypothetical protein H5410_036483 [Solanum commersonii]|uniref:Uncharacterized protein n=1 Tax=Solanum commersonii TaxID=4109 RepID=A0A9J5Y3M9_SOLCO|nr:hypothetical protein H5410_036483 [Solanum commersonii]
MKIKQPRRKNGRMMELKQARRNIKKKKSRRPIDLRGYCRSISSPVSDHHDTHLFAILVWYAHLDIILF